ncbi:MAG: hypothetical protein SGI74_07135 [Oligoflexia bacterium]|nr:hypothetical protein [Oligoflexia bacterium]
MERVGDLMEEMGFNKDAQDSVKAAFIKNLIKQAYGVDVALPLKYQKLTEITGDEGILIDKEGQLSFKF